MFWHIFFFFAPYALTAGSAAYLEAKYGAKLLAAAQKDLLAAKSELAALKAKVL